MRKLKFVAFFIFINSLVSAQAIYSDKDVEICNSKFEFAVSQKLSELPINDVLTEIGKTFLGLDYEAATLEKGDTEQLVIHLTGLDCYTFFESSLVFSRCIKKGDANFETYQKELTNIRYRNGVIDQYPSRLHYASDWLIDNEKRGNVKDVTKEIGGVEYKKKIDFMSTHINSYKQLKNNPSFVEAIIATENEMNSRTYYYVPQNDIECIEENIHNGDIILITASAKGLDISHTGMAIMMEDGRIHFMHAPIAGKKLEITEKPLADYIKSHDRHTGIMVARLLEP